MKHLRFDTPTGPTYVVTSSAFLVITFPDTPAPVEVNAAEVEKNLTKIKHDAKLYVDPLHQRLADLEDTVKKLKVKP